MARRMPISRVRCVTLASMMFMIPIPPTRSEIAAMKMSTWLRMFFVFCRWRMSSSGTVTAKSATPLWRRKSMRSASAADSRSMVASRARRMISVSLSARRSTAPIRRIEVEMGMNTVRSASRDSTTAPDSRRERGASTPTTAKGRPSICKVFPRGLSRGNAASRTASPITHTSRDSASS